MLYADDFVVSLPLGNVHDAILKVLNVFFDHAASPFGVKPEDIIEARALVLALAESHDVEFPEDFGVRKPRQTR
jgi:hypothetical protein